MEYKEFSVFYKSPQAFVFDFGAEVYLWLGHGVPIAERKVAMDLTLEIWNQGYNYTSCQINPVSPLKSKLW